LKNWQKRALVYAFTTAGVLATVKYMEAPSYEYEAQDHIDSYVNNLDHSTEQSLTAISDEGIKYTFNNFPGLSQNELTNLVETYHDHVYPTALIAHTTHYNSFELEQLLEGKNVIDYVKSLDVNRDYSYEEFSRLMNTDSKNLVSQLDPRSQHMREQQAQSFNNTYFRNIALNFTYQSIQDGYRVIALNKTSLSPIRFHLNDVIIALDDHDFTQGGTHELSDLIAEVNESEVIHFTVKRPSQEEPITIDIPRSDMTKTPLQAFVLDHNKLYLKLDNITLGSDQLIRKAYQTAMDTYGDKITSIVLDLKDNGGGSVEAAHKIIDAFTTQADLGSSTSRNFTPPTLGEMVFGGYKTHLTNHFKGQTEQLSDLPMAILINSNTASAAEMIAGALQDLKRASVFGATNSHGKASMQIPFFLTTAKQERIQLNLTTGLLNRPNGSSHQAVGISPDIKTPLTQNQQARKQAFDDAYLAKNSRLPIYFENQYANHIPNPTNAQPTSAAMTCTITDEVTSYGVQLQNIDSDALLATNTVGNNELICALDYLRQKSKPLTPPTPQV
jgi:carboxyl-terminal processing protease